MSAEDFEPQDTLKLSLPADGSWVDFFVAGEYGAPSSEPGDAKILVLRDGAEIGSFSTSVRVRKNADDLSEAEWARFLRALAALHDMSNGSGGSQYAKYPAVHGSAWDMAHSDAAFLPWHRAFILALERELQAIDPFVSLPYWKFDETTAKVFTAETLGAPPTGPTGSVRFASENPIAGWSMGSLGSLLRPGDGTGRVPVLPLTLLFRLNPTYARIRDAIESEHHGSAHNRLRGWAAGARSPADPAFFLLHSHVDRAWGLWQADKRAFDPSDETSYAPQGSWEAAGRPTTRSKGQWSEDTLWPWDGDDNRDAGRYRLDDVNWIGFPQPSQIEFPIVAPFAPRRNPNISDTVDYLAIRGDRDPLGYCYDDVGFER